MYDVIGDIHGHADALRRLLSTLGYSFENDCWRHPERTAVFLGDFIDRGPQIREVLEIVRPMVEEGAARAVMGNHEFNAIAFHMPHPTANEAYLRERSYRNIRQYRETVAQLTDAQLDEYIKWFQTLPMWLELEGLRIVHACWDPDSMGIVERHRVEHGGFTDAFFHLACERDEELFDAVEVILKGKEVDLPAGVSFHDKDGNKRRRVRTRWFADPKDAATFRDYAFTLRPEERERMPSAALTPKVLESARPYPKDAPPVLFGHYWMPGDIEPEPLAANVACLDYSVARGGRLCAYRWNGEAELRRDGFVAVPAREGGA